MSHASTLRVPRFPPVAPLKEARPHEIDKRTRIRRKIFALAHDDAVGALWKVRAHVAHREPRAVRFADADAGHDRDAEPHRDILLDDFPAADFDRDAIRHLALLKDEI